MHNNCQFQKQQLVNTEEFQVEVHSVKTVCRMITLYWKSLIL